MNPTDADAVQAATDAGLTAATPDARAVVLTPTGIKSGGTVDARVSPLLGATEGDFSNIVPATTSEWSAQKLAAFFWPITFAERLVRFAADLIGIGQTFQVCCFLAVKED